VKNHKFYVEKLYYFSCASCKKLWIIGKWEEDETVVCPHCGYEAIAVYGLVKKKVKTKVLRWK